MKAVDNGTWVDTSPHMTELPHDRQGVFETLLRQAGRTLFWDDHWARFTAGCAWAGFETPVPAPELQACLEQLAQANAVSNGVVRYAAWREGDRVRWRLEVSPPRPLMQRASASLSFGPTLPPPDPSRGHKHLARTEWHAALRTARARGFDEVLLFGPGDLLVEGAVTNVFLVTAGVVQTPPLTDGPLPGIARRHVIAAARHAGLFVEEAPVSRAAILRADEIWLSNSLLLLRPVHRVGDAELSRLRPVLGRVRKAWLALHGIDPTAPLA